MSELDKLEAYLKENGIEYERKDHEPDVEVPSCFPQLNWHQIISYTEDGRKWDAICHHGSYGNEKGLLEIYGSITKGNDVEGWLTAQDVIDRIEAYV